MTTNESPLVLTVDATCQLLGVSRTSVWKLGKSGEIRGLSVAGRRMFLRESVDAYIQRQLEAAAVEAVAV